MTTRLSRLFMSACVKGVGIPRTPPKRELLGPKNVPLCSGANRADLGESGPRMSYGQGLFLYQGASRAEPPTAESRQPSVDSLVNKAFSTMSAWLNNSPTLRRLMTPRSRLTLLLLMMTALFTRIHQWG